MGLQWGDSAAEKGICQGVNNLHITLFSFTYSYILILFSVYSISCQLLANKINYLQYLAPIR